MRKRMADALRELWGAVVLVVSILAWMFTLALWGMGP